MHDVHVTDYCVDGRFRRRHRMRADDGNLEGIAPIQRAHVVNATAIVDHHCYGEGVEAGIIPKLNVPIIPRERHSLCAVHAMLKAEDRIDKIVLTVRYSAGRDSHKPGRSLDFDIKKYFIAGLLAQNYAYPDLARLGQCQAV